jgi:hypothetical protein
LGGFTRTAVAFDVSSAILPPCVLRRGLLLQRELEPILDPETMRDGLCRLDPISRLGASIVPDPGSDVGGMCALDFFALLRSRLLNFERAKNNIRANRGLSARLVCKAAERHLRPAFTDKAAEYCSSSGLYRRDERH